MFWTTLIEAIAPTQKALDSLKANCTHVKGDYWIMEGEVDALGGLAPAQLVKICWEAYGVRL